MAKSLPPFNWLRSFEAAARNLSFTAAAEEIGLTQSAVSQQVKALETRLGQRLFNRHARGLALTDAGRRLLPEIEGPLQALANAMVGVDAGADRNLLTIAASVSVADWIIAPRLPDFQARFPKVKIRLLSTIWPDDFHTIRADVEIRFGSARQVGEDAEAVQPGNLIAVKAPSLTGPFADLPLIEAVGTSSGWQAWGRQVGAVAAPSLFTDTYGMALHLAAQGNGVALVSEWLARPAIAAGRVARAHPASIPSNEGYFLSTAVQKPEAAALREMLLR